MGRPKSLSDDSGHAWVQDATYDYAGRMQSMQYLGTTETRSYNSSGQLGGINWNTPGVAAMTGGVQYSYSATGNNGQVTQTTDTMSGEATVYQYDSLKRLIAADSTPTAGSATPRWNEHYGYDGFGNLSSKTLNGALQSIPVNPQTNRLTNAVYDANGNMTSGAGASLVYNMDNRMVRATELSGGMEIYWYAPDGKRMGRSLSDGTQLFMLNGIHGEELGTFTNDAQTGYASTRALSMNVYFAGRLIWQGSPNVAPPFFGGRAGIVLADRLGTNRASGARFRPYGDEITSTTNDRVKFGTYTRDSYTGLDISPNRAYGSTYGRFSTADPEYGGEIVNPISMNLYSYTLGDPVNSNDPSGLASTPTCGSSGFNFNGAYQGTISQIMSGSSNQSILAGAMYTESGHGRNVDVKSEEIAIGSVIMNRWEFVNANAYLFSSEVGLGSRPISTAGWGTPGDSVASIVQNPSQFAIYSRNPDGSVSMSASAMNNLDSAINSSYASSGCEDLAWAITIAYKFWGERTAHPLYAVNNLVLTGFNSFSPAHSSALYEQNAGSFGDANVFYGVPGSYVSSTVPAPAARRGRRPGIPAPPRPPSPPGALQ